MSITKGVLLMRKVDERNRRINKTNPPALQTNMPITEKNAIRLLSPLSNTVVTNEDYKFALKVLETVTPISESTARSVANYIANNITIGLDGYVSEDIRSYDTISESNKRIVFDGVL